MQAFETAASSNTKSIISNEKVYYLSEDNNLGLSLANIQVREGYFKCTYDDGILLITQRLSDGAAGLDVLTTNNPDSFTKKQGNGYEYYYDSDDNADYYYWLQDGTFLQLNIPKGIDLSLDEIIADLAYMPIG